VLYTGRGSTALWALLIALDRSHGHIIVPANICELVVAVILKAGWQPVFCDVDPLTGNADLDDFDAAWTPATACVLAVSNFGTPLPMDDIQSWARSKGVTLIEDVCNALGATSNDRALGTFGDAAIYSFGYGKIIEHRTGGGLVVRDPALQTRLEHIIGAMAVYSERHRQTDRSCQEQLRTIRRSPGLQTAEAYRALYDTYADDLWYRIGDEDTAAIQAALERLPENLRRRRELAAIYQEGIRGPAVTLRPQVRGDVFWRFTFMVARSLRPTLLAMLRAEGLLASTWYPPVQRLFVPGASDSDFPGAEEFGATVINLFTDYRVTRAAAEKAVTVVNRFA
jgi:perosamine synthetase